jgi:hypothetical protein
LDPIVVTKKQSKNRQVFQANATEQQKKEVDAKTKQRIQMADAIYIKSKEQNHLTDMKKTLLFALDLKTEEILVSETEKGSNKVHLIERIKRDKNQILFDAVVTLNRIVNSSDFDVAIFKAMDKVCQMVYIKHADNK